MHLDVTLACAEGPSEAKISGERCLKDGGRERGKEGQSE